jgi:hypothetical protein
MTVNVPACGFKVLSKESKDPAKTRFPFQPPCIKPLESWSG